MSEKVIWLNEIQEKIADWARTNKLDTLFEGIYIFGSLINRDGRHFVPQGSMSSDVDLIMVFTETQTDALKRYMALSKVRSVVDDLEHSTSKVLGRATEEAIYSLLPLTKYEIHQCIHKGHDPKLFTSNLFHDVLAEKPVAGGLADYVDYDYHFENLEAFSVMRLCQSYRNEYLQCNQIGQFSQQAFNGETVYPKELLRGAALLGFFKDGKADESRRTDLEVGQSVLTDYLHSLRGKDQCIDQLIEKVDGRGFARAKQEPLDPDDMLLIHELMFDAAKAEIIPSVRDAIRDVMESDPRNNGG